MIGIKVKHFSNQFVNKGWTPLLEDFGESNTDTSSYRPDISVARAEAGRLSGKRLIYDFNDGKDTGETVMTFIRQKGLDITEVDAAVARVKSNIDESIEDSKKKLKESEKAAKVDKMIDSIINDSGVSSDSKGTDGTTVAGQ